MHGPAVAAGLPPDALSCMTEVTPRGHAGADAAPRHRRDPGHRRHRPRARGLLLGQARLRRRPRQRPRLHREDGRRAEGRAATSSTARPSTTARCARPSSRSSATRPIKDQVVAEVEEERRLLPERGRGGGGRAGRGHPAAAGQPRDRGQAGRRTSPRRRGSRSRPRRACWSRRWPAWAATIPLSIEKLSPGARLLRGQGLARGLRARACSSCATAAPATRWPSTARTTR